MSELDMIDSDRHVYCVDLQYNDCRLDKFLVTQLQSYTRNFIKNLIDNGQVLVDNCVQKAGYCLKLNQTVTVVVVKVDKDKVVPKNIDIDILYQDESIVIINKPQGLTVHPSAGHHDDTLVNALLYKVDRLSTVNGEFRPGIVHRLDKDTSGVMVVAKTDSVHNYISEQFANRKVKKQYLGVVEGIVKDDSMTINTAIARSTSDRKKMTVSQRGRLATTEYKIVDRLDNKTTFLEFDIHTGRTHQIRVHCKHIGHPIVGDAIYGSTKHFKQQLLHAHSLSFIHPDTKKKVVFVAPLPKYFNDYVNQHRLL